MTRIVQRARSIRVRRVLMCVYLASASVCLLSVPVAAQVGIRTDLDTTLITVGDRITLSVRVSHPADALVIWPDSLDLRPFELLGAQVLPMEFEGERRISSASFVLTAFELGELDLPSFAIAVDDGAGERQTVSTDGFAVEVVTVGQDETGDIREIRGPLMIPVSVLRVTGWIVALLVAGVVGAWLYRRWARARSGVAVVEAGPPPRPPHEVALEALDSLQASDLLMRGAVKEYHIEASDILRRYLEARFGVTALEMTTWEIVEALRDGDTVPEFREDLRRFLDRCDLVKFAKVRPAPEVATQVVELGRELVRGSMPESDRDEVVPSDEAVSDSGSPLESID